MKKIYIVLTDTGTFLGRLVKIYTKKEYSHSSISLDENLEEMYSMGRLQAYNPFIGGLVHEEVHGGTFKRFKNTKALVLSKEVEDEQYEKMKKAIDEMYLDKENYKFNTKGLFMVIINKKRIKEKYFYCAEFVRHILDQGEIEHFLPPIIIPEDFRKLDNLKKVYKGYLRDYPQKEKVVVK